MKKYKCSVCGYIHEGDTPPAKCPVCGVPAEKFELIEDSSTQKKSKGFLGGKDSSAYIIFYSVVMVVLVAVVLAVTSLSLQDKQNANIMNEKKDAITASMGEAIGTYDQLINAFAVDNSGKVIESISADDALNMLFDLPAAFADGTYPVFENKENGEVVIPLTGKGLWDDIWGYIALEGDMNTVKGVVFDHAGETPGLGAEIATPKYQAQFPGKEIFNNGELVSISVVKGGAEEGDKHGVDAISGGTKTCDGLENMIRNCLTYYVPYFESKTVGANETNDVEPVNTESNE